MASGWRGGATSFAGTPRLVMSAGTVVTSDGDRVMHDEAVRETSDGSTRAVQDTHDRTWHVYPVIEVSKVGAPRRTSWLCLDCGDDRRFIAPVPEGWRLWSDATLLHWISVAKPDLRS